ncbi:MAG: GspE/PulE family protein [Armatimonadota bacterium]
MANGVPDGIHPQNLRVPAEAIALMTREQALRFRVCPVSISPPNVDGMRTLTLASADARNPQLVRELQRALGCGITLVAASEDDIQQGIEAHYKENYVDAPTDLIMQTGNAETSAQGAAHAAESSAATTTVEAILQRAVAQRATDIHVEPHEDGVYVRFRIDGILYDSMKYETALHPQIISRIKILSNLDIAQNRAPQDGRFDVRMGKHTFDVRVSVVPLTTGQKAALRLLPKHQAWLNFTQLGLNDRNREQLEQMISRPHGMVLATGPTGSGKTTTMYACMAKIDFLAKNVITIEDPVEYRIPRIGQIQVNPKAGLTFATGLRSILRQDPDVILVGEVRDPETLDMAVHSALTGHLVLSTLHCTDAAAAAARMVDMGAEPFLVASATTSIISQRLVRRLCEKCKQAAPPSDLARAQLKLEDDGIVYYQAVGCPHCRGIGYLGRISVFEVVPMSEPIQRAIMLKAPAGDIRGILRELDIPSLLDDGLEKARAGVTSLDEVLRAVYIDIV